jgi:hypothetical protein
MARSKDSLGWLVLLACAVVLVFAVVVDRRIARQGEVPPAAPNAPKAEAPAIAPSGPRPSPAAAGAPKTEVSAGVPSVAAPSAAAIAAEEAAREASWREARAATIRVQQRLRAEQQAREAAQQEAAKNERCVDGQRMKRIENGWVQAGTCDTRR